MILMQPVKLTAHLLSVSTFARIKAASAALPVWTACNPQMRGVKTVPGKTCLQCNASITATFRVMHVIKDTFATTSSSDQALCCLQTSVLRVMHSKTSLNPHLIIVFCCRQPSHNWKTETGDPWIGMGCRKVAQRH